MCARDCNPVAVAGHIDAQVPPGADDALFVSPPSQGGVLPDDPESVREFLDDMRSHRV